MQTAVAASSNDQLAETGLQLKMLAKTPATEYPMTKANNDQTVITMYLPGKMRR